MQRKQTQTQNSLHKENFKNMANQIYLETHGSLGADAKAIKMKKEYDKLKQVLLLPLSTSLSTKNIDKMDE